MRCEPLQTHRFNHTEPSVTYGRLDAVLRGLGFVFSEPEAGTRVYRHPASGALVTLPALPDTQPVLPRHLVGARMVLNAFGIAEPPEFANRLRAG